MIHGLDFRLGLDLGLDKAWAWVGIGGGLGLGLCLGYVRLDRTRSLEENRRQMTTKSECLQ